MSDLDRIHAMYARLVEAAPAWEPTSLQPHAGDPFKVLVTAMLSTQTREETTRAAARRLFALADSPQTLLDLPEDTLRAAIRGVSFYNTKTAHLRQLSARLAADGGQVPATLDALMHYEGVGWKVAALVLVVGHGLPGPIAVDTHVDRISKRLGLVDPGLRSPRAVGEALQAVLPAAYWPRWNDLLVQFGRAICVARSPRCAACPLADLCPRVGMA